ncbi:MAG: hypothetical protein GW917_02935 [Bdellovibrionales bacterium]|nr:hypothetical protein [Bdellovibrionales bacterium]
MLLSLSMALSSPSQNLAQAKSLLDINVSGKKGNPASDGRNGSRGSWSGQDGTRGGNASPPTDGKPAGEMELKIGESVKGVLEIKAKLTPSGSKRAKSESFKVEFGTSGSVYALALGGDAQPGGIGGDGGDGARGSDGSDATRFSNGTDGGNGGDGGDGGFGTDASLAGKGGRILIETSIKDLSLLMLVEPNVSGGRGAQAGRHGQGGKGGAGGDGGDSYSWTESHTTTNSKGEETTTTTHHSNSGGSDGYRGRDGQTPTYPTLHSSSNGKNGLVTYRVWEDEKKFTDYASRYDLKVDSYEIVSENKDGFLEPGETVYVNNLTVRNVGDMPTPSDASITMYLNDQQFITNTGVQLELSQSLKSGESHTFDQPLSFKVKDIQFTPGEERQVWREEFTPQAFQNRSNRDYINDEKVETLTFSFPIEMEAIQGLRTLAPGEATALSFRIKNISKRPFGSKSEIKRAIEYYLKKTRSDLEGYEVELFTSSGGDIDFTSEIIQAVENLGPGQSTVVSAVLGVREGVAPFKSTEIAMGLGLDKPTDPKVRKIQERVYTLRTAAQYRRNPKSKVLLVANSEISGDVIRSFRSQVESLGEEMTVWDLSYEGHLDLNQKTQLDRTLMKDFAGGLIIVPTNEYGISDEKFKPEVQLRKSQFLEAAAQHGIQIMFVGREEKQHILDDYLAPSEGVETNVASSIRQFMRAFKSEALRDQTSQQEYGQGILSSYNAVHVNRFVAWGRPKREAFEAKAKAVADKLSRLDREQNWVTVYNFEPEALSKGFFGRFFRKWSYGQITLIRSIDKHQPSGSYVTVEERALLDGTFARSDELKLALLQNLSFDSNIQLLEKYIVDREFAERELHQLPLVIESLVSYLAWEQALMRDRVVSFGSVKEEDFHFLSRVSKIQAIVGSSTLPQVSDALKDLAAKSYAIVKSEVSIWDFLTPFKQSEQVSRLSRKLIRQYISKVFSYEEGLLSRLKFLPTREDRIQKEINTKYKEEFNHLKSAVGIGFFQRLLSGFEGAGLSQARSGGSHVRKGNEAMAKFIDLEELKAMISRGTSQTNMATVQDQATQKIRADLQRPHPTNGQPRCEELLRNTDQNPYLVPSDRLKLHAGGRG